VAKTIRAILAIEIRGNLAKQIRQAQKSGLGIGGVSDSPIAWRRVRRL